MVTVVFSWPGGGRMDPIFESSFDLANRHQAYGLRYYLGYKLREENFLKIGKFSNVRDFLAPERVGFADPYFYPAGDESKDYLHPKLTEEFA